MSLRIVAPHFVARLDVTDTMVDNVVVFAAPILAYMRGWRVSQVRAYCALKHWECAEL